VEDRKKTCSAFSGTMSYCSKNCGEFSEGVNYHSKMRNELSRTANYHSKIHAAQNNRHHKNVGKFPQNIVSSEISLKSQEKPGILSKFVCTTFEQYCKCTGMQFLLFFVFFHFHLNVTSVFYTLRAF